ncbi:hypothetical protein PVAND_004517 [Polypedilum vanderplanki]|uniref:Reticulon-like protein n=1 Tax=Polypedilum vanderplanki TaxID=319348 RepID=A0A9J6BXZ3_POLVA|nr:hypothetical protein PVAND_004517 [Polypedilum vanderplanki]
MDNNEIEKLLNFSEDNVRIADNNAEIYKDDDFYDGISEDKNDILIPNVPIANADVPKVVDPPIFEQQQQQQKPPSPPPHMTFLKEEPKDEHFKSSEDLLNFSEAPTIETPKKFEKPNNAEKEDIKILKSDDIKPDAWFKVDRLHPKVESLIYWRDVKKSGIVFGIGLSILLALSMFSLISVFAYTSLAALSASISFRIYKNVQSAIQKSSDGHPFKDILDIDLTLSQDRANQIAGLIISHFNAYITELRRLFLVEDLIDSLKFGLLLWLLTYVGAIFNGMTVVILAYIAMFTLPKVYESNKQTVDQYLDLVRGKINELTEKAKAAIPIGKNEESSKDK